MMKLCKGLRVVLALVFLAPGSAAQSFFTRTYEENDGLVNSTVYDLAQDASGRMWFATSGGISVYDGAAWTSHTSGTGLPAQDVRCIRVDAEGRIWAVGSNPAWILMCFDGRSWASFPFPPSAAVSYCTALAVRPEGREVRVAVGTSGSGIFVFDGIRWRTITKTGGLAGSEVRNIIPYQGGFLVATEKGLSWAGENSIENRWAGVDPLLAGDIRGAAVEAASGGDVIWLLGSRWLGIFQDGRLRILRRENPLLFSSNFPAAKVLPDGKGGLFFGNPVSIFYYDPSSASAYPLGVRNGLIAEGAAALFLDRESNVWIGGFRGVSRISSRRFHNYRSAQGLLEDEVTAIQAFGDGVVAFGHNFGLTIWDGRELRKIALKAKPDAPPGQIRVLDLAGDDRGGLWLAAASLGLGSLEGNDRIRWRDVPGNPTHPVTSVVFDENRRLWIAQSDALFQLRKGRPVEVFPGMFKGCYIRKIVAARGGLLFVATTKHGLFRWDGSSWTRSSGDEASGVSNVFSVYLDSNGRTLVGTLAGLRLLAGDRLDLFSENGFEIRRPVYLILEDRAGRLWFGTDNGVVRWDGRTRRDFTKAEGLAGREVNRSAGMIDSLGRIWIGTNTGASCYRENFDLGPDDVPPPTVSITGLDVNGTPADLSAEIVLGYRENNLMFHFQGTSFINEGALRFESYLAGFDKTWGAEYAAADRRIRYTNLPAGSYVFHLRAKNALGTRSEAVSSPVIRIRNPFWLQWWFLLASFLLAGGLILTIGLAVTQHRQAERLEALVLDRTAQIQASLREKEVLLKEVHHRVKNNLQIISSLLFLQSRRISDPGLMSVFKGTISRVRAMALVHESLYRSDQLTLIDMDEYFRKLVYHLLEIYDVRKAPVAADIRAERISLPLETAITYGLIVNELVSNALKHAFPSERKGVVKITLSRVGLDAEEDSSREKGIELTVVDNGVGIPEAVKNGSPDSLGLRLVQNLASQLDGKIDVRNEGGTVVRIFFPE